MNSTQTAKPFGGPGSSSRIQMLRFGAVFDRFGVVFDRKRRRDDRKRRRNDRKRRRNATTDMKHGSSYIQPRHLIVNGLITGLLIILLSLLASVIWCSGFPPKTIENKPKTSEKISKIFCTIRSFARSLENFSNFSSRQRDRFGPKIVKFRAILAAV